MRNGRSEARGEEKYEDEVEAPMRKLGQKVAQAVFAVRGESMAPDATFTLRLSNGVAKGYAEKGKGPLVDRFLRHVRARDGRRAYKLPQRWVDKKSALKLDTPYNLVSTDDIIGGNSGSPLINAQGELVGLIFDGNLRAFRIATSTARARSARSACDTAGMIEALNHIYDDEALTKELKPRARKKKKKKSPAPWSRHTSRSSTPTGGWSSPRASPSPTPRLYNEDLAPDAARAAHVDHLHVRGAVDLAWPTASRPTCWRRGSSRRA